MRPKASGAGLVCRTDQYFQCQRLTYTCRIKLDQQLLHFYKFLKIGAPNIIVLLKARKLLKLTDVDRLFHALMTLLTKKLFILTL